MIHTARTSRFSANMGWSSSDTFFRYASRSPSFQPFPSFTDLAISSCRAEELASSAAAAAAAAPAAAEEEASADRDAIVVCSRLLADVVFIASATAALLLVFLCGGSGGLAPGSETTCATLSAMLGVEPSWGTTRAVPLQWRLCGACGPEQEAHPQARCPAASTHQEPVRRSSVG